MAGLCIFDGDDTLWRSEHLYDEARDRAAEVVVRAGLDRQRWSDMQREIDVANVATFGLSRWRFPLSSVAAYERLAAEEGSFVDDTVKEAVRRAAASVFDANAPIMPGAPVVLEELAKTHRLALLTQGDPVVQQKRVEDSGLGDLFEITHIVDRKDDSCFSSILLEAGVDPVDAWSVGNSLPSDINPALRLGMRAVWIDAHVWAHERREVAPVDGRLFVCDSLGEVPAVVIERSLLTQ